MGIFRDVKDYIGDSIGNWRKRRQIEKQAYEDAYLESKIGFLKEKGAIDAKIHVFGKDSINLNQPKTYEKGIR